MAGYGKRLESYARGVPKPYLNLAGKPSFIWALSSFDLSCFSKITFITSRSIFEFQDPILILKQTMRTEIDAECVILESVPNGQALSLREGLLRSDVPTSFCVFNCDTVMERIDDEWLNQASGLDGALGVFPSTNPALSYVKVNSTNAVIETAEKEVISNWASSGLYWFKSKSTFLDLNFESGQYNQEVYIAPLYNQMINNGQHVAAITNSNVFPIGTESEIEKFMTSPFRSKFLNDKNR
jgi:NDP-sugar pyrophosphorylase family protein